MGLFIPGFIIPTPSVSQGPLVLTFLDANGSSSNSSTYNFSNLNAGDPGDADNYMVFAFVGEADNTFSPEFTISSATFGSNSLTFLGRQGRTDEETYHQCELWGGYISGAATQSLSYTWSRGILRSIYARAKIKGSTTIVNDTGRRQGKFGDFGDYTFDSFTLNPGEVWISAAAWRGGAEGTTFGQTEHAETATAIILRSTFNSNSTAGTVSASGTSNGNAIVAVGIVLTP